MDEIKSVLEMLKGASPWVVVTGGVILALWLWFKHKRELNEETETSKLASQLEDGNKRIEEVRDMVALLAPQVASISTQLGAASTELSHHYAETDANNRAFAERLSESNDRFKEMSKILKQMLQELVSFNSSQPGKVINPENTKLIIQYQWNWCRDECIRLLKSSVERNGIRGKEDSVALRLFRAWRTAAKRATESLTRFQGLQYQFNSLFEASLRNVWQECWSMSIPLYHRVGIANSQDLESALDFLEEQARASFEAAADDFFAKADDLDSGIIYGGRRAVSSEEIAPVPEVDMGLLRAMSDSLKNYTPAKDTDSAVEQAKFMKHMALARRQAREEEKDTTAFFRGNSEYQPADLPESADSAVSSPRLKPQD